MSTLAVQAGVGATSMKSEQDLSLNAGRSEQSLGALRSLSRRDGREPHRTSWRRDWSRRASYDDDDDAIPRRAKDGGFSSKSHRPTVSRAHAATPAVSRQIGAVAT